MLQRADLDGGATQCEVEDGDSANLVRRTGSQHILVVIENAQKEGIGTRSPEAIDTDQVEQQGSKIVMQVQKSISDQVRVSGLGDGSQEGGVILHKVDQIDTD